MVNKGEGFFVEVYDFMIIWKFYSSSSSQFISCYFYIISQIRL